MESRYSRGWDFKMRLIAVLACAVTLACSGAVSSHADPRVALIIGNSAYRHVSPLDNPTTDARLMAETLRSLGFTVVGGGAQLDLDKAGIDRAVQAFGARLQGAEAGPHRRRAQKSALSAVGTAVSVP